MLAISRVLNAGAEHLKISFRSIKKAHCAVAVAVAVVAGDDVAAEIHSSGLDEEIQMPSTKSL